jgi:hypothetical protein
MKQFEIILFEQRNFYVKNLIFFNKCSRILRVQISSLNSRSTKLIELTIFSWGTVCYYRTVWCAALNPEFSARQSNRLLA